MSEPFDFRDADSHPIAKHFIALASAIEALPERGAAMEAFETLRREAEIWESGELPPRADNPAEALS